MSAGLFDSVWARGQRTRVCLSTLKLNHETRLRGENETVLENGPHCRHWDDAKGPADLQSSGLGEMSREPEHDP